MKPFISILIPTYQMGGLVGDAIRSCLGQEYENFEIIVGDNASTDDTERVVGQISSARLTYVKNEFNIGMYPNLNKLIKLAKGDYVKICCADDTLERGCLQKIAAELVRCSFPLGLSHAISIASTAGNESRIRKTKFSTFDKNYDSVDSSCVGEYIYFGSVCGWALTNIVFHRITFLEFGGFETSGDGKDYAKDAVTWVMFLMQHRCVLLKEHLYIERVHASQNRFTRPKLLCLDEMLDLNGRLLAAPISMEQKKFICRFQRKVIARYYVSGWILKGEKRVTYCEEMTKILSKFGNPSAGAFAIIFRLLETARFRLIRQICR